MKLKNIFSLIYISTLALAVPVADTEESNETAEFCMLNEHSTSINKSYRGKYIDTIYNLNYEMWHNKDSHGTCYFYDDGSFGYSVEGCKNCFCSYGLSFDGSKTHEKIGHLYADFKFVRNNYRRTPGVDDYSYVGIHGRGRDSQNSPIEFYIIDSTLSDNGIGKWDENKGHGDIIIDGDTYSVYKYDTRKDPPMKDDDTSDTSSTQIFSVRKNLRDCGTIDITAHFRQWKEKLGIKLGILNDVKFIIEFHNTDDKVENRGDFTYAKIRVKRKCIIWNQMN